MPDVRLIDANVLVKQIEETHCKDCNSYNGVMCRACTWMDAMDYIEDAPTVDAQPVKHGMWETKGGVHCTRCGWRPTGRVCDLFTDYCAGCGAKMDGDSDETT